MRRYITALSAVVVVLAFVATSASAAKPSLGFSATMAITSTDTTTDTCSGTLTVSWSVQGKGGVTGITWSADASDTGTLTLGPPGRGSVQQATEERLHTG